MTIRTGALFLIVLALCPTARAAGTDDASSARALYTRALGHERTVRDAAHQATLRELRAAVREYEIIVRRYPTSAFCDNALWQGANLSTLAFARFAQEADLATATRLLTQLAGQYPSSSLVPRAQESLKTLAVAANPVTTTPPVGVRGTSAMPRPTPIAPAGEPATIASPTLPIAIRDVRRTPLADGTRVTIVLDTETRYHVERLENPRRVFFDLKGARPIAALLDATLKYTDDVVREIRLGRHPQNTTRIVMDMEGVDSYSVFSLYNPFRLVIDFKAVAAVRPAGAQPAAVNVVPLVASPQASAPTGAGPPTAPMAHDSAVPLDTLPSRPVTALSRTPPSLPSANSDGKFSLARQLGLGVSRIVIDAGHGGHDPGAKANGVSESEVVLDVAQRLARLLQKQTAIDVVMTRDTDVFIPLDERTAIANREGADLFLSIHANASRSPKAHGVESYFLNFASNPEAEAVAARENAGSSKTMHSLPEIVRAIALNDKINESRDFAGAVQRAMVKRLSGRNTQLRDLGVKQAPFVVLIGAAMPSVLAEISFVTHRQEAQLLKTGAYRQQIAEALLDAVLLYQQSLKKIKTAGAQVGAR